MFQEMATEVWQTPMWIKIALVLLTLLASKLFPQWTAIFDGIKKLLPFDLPDTDEEGNEASPQVLILRLLEELLNRKESLTNQRGKEDECAECQRTIDGLMELLKKETDE